MRDTSPEAIRYYFDLLRRKSAAERLRMAAAITNATREIAEAGIRSREPGLTRRQVQARLAQRMYGTTVARRLFGADLPS